MIRILLFVFIGILGLSSCKDEVPNKIVDSSPEIVTNVSEKSEDKEEKAVIMFYGNSLTAGYGLEEENSFPSRIDDILKENNFDYKVINAGLSGETTSGGLKRIDWVLNQKVDIFFLELGANDMLRGLPLEETESNLRDIIETVKTKYPNVQVALCQMLASPNMGKEYADAFQKIYTKIAKELNLVLVPFFLDGVAGNTDLLLPDGKHPNIEGQKIVAQNIWKTLEGML